MVGKRKMMNEQHPAIQHLGRYLAAARRKRGWTQAQLARNCGFDPAHISLFESGKRRPNLVQLLRLAEALRVPLQTFLTGTDRAGTSLRDLAVELWALGLVDLMVPGASVPGSFRPPEEIVARALVGEQLEPRVIEALPAALAWNDWNVPLLVGYGQAFDRRVAHRLAWLADIALTLHHGQGFPGGCRSPESLAAFLNQVAPAAEADSLGWPAAAAPRSAVWRRWNITYAADLATFRRRAEQLAELRARELPDVAPPEGPADGTTNP